MLELVISIPHRNRPIAYLTRTLESLLSQLRDGVAVVVVDYGSEPKLQEQIQHLVAPMERVQFCAYATQGQLWNKSRCVNSVLIQHPAQYLMVADVDMLWHPQALEQITKNLDDAINYYQVGFLSKEQTQEFTHFENAEVAFKSDHEATGISVFPTQALLEINGFDEYYHGWGSEDTDAHLRCRHAGYEVRFRESELLFKHQWHEKTYRGAHGQLPHHDHLERVNMAYCLQTEAQTKIKANQHSPIGVIHSLDPKKESSLLKCQNTYKDLYALRAQLLDFSGQIQIEVVFNKPDLKFQLKQLIKPGKEIFLSFKEVQRFWINYIISHHRDRAYHFELDHQKESLQLWLEC